MVESLRGAGLYLAIRFTARGDNAVLVAGILERNTIRLRPGQGPTDLNLIIITLNEQLHIFEMPRAPSAGSCTGAWEPVTEHRWSREGLLDSAWKCAGELRLDAR